MNMVLNGRLSSVSDEFRDLSDKALAPPPLPLPASPHADRRTTPARQRILPAPQTSFMGGETASNGFGWRCVRP